MKTKQKAVRRTTSFTCSVALDLSPDVTHMVSSSETTKRKISDLGDIHVNICSENVNKKICTVEHTPASHSSFKTIATRSQVRQGSPEYYQGCEPRFGNPSPMANTNPNIISTEKSKQTSCHFPATTIMGSQSETTELFSPEVQASHIETTLPNSPTQVIIPTLSGFTPTYSVPCKRQHPVTPTYSTMEPKRRNTKDTRQVETPNTTDNAHTSSERPCFQQVKNRCSSGFYQTASATSKKQCSVTSTHSRTETQSRNTQVAGTVGPSNATCNANIHSKRPRFRQVTSSDINGSNNYAHANSRQRRRTRQGPPDTYVSIGSCNQVCRHCKASFWYDERIKYGSKRFPEYHRCCNNGKVKLPTPGNYPDYIKQLFQDRHFMENIRAYNQMFAMTSLGAEIDDSVNRGRGPYVFKVSGKIYHWIGSMCPEQNKEPKFLQLYIYDTTNEVNNRLGHFKNSSNRLQRDVVQNLKEVLDRYNHLVQFFRTARDKMETADIPDFKLKLFGVVGSKQYDLPEGDSIGAIVFEGGPDVSTEFDVVIEQRGGEPQRIDKLNPHYMSLHFPLLFIHGEAGYHLGLKLLDKAGNTPEKEKQMSLKMYYAYQLHDRVQQYNLILRGGRLFQEYIVTAYCSIEQNRLDYIRNNQKDIRNEYMSGLYDALSRGDADGSDVGSRTILPASFTGGPRYMYSHYLDALAICRVHGNPSFFITFTCNVGWPEIEEYMQQYPHVTTADRPDVVDRVFERKIHDLVSFLREVRPFGDVEAVLYTVEFQKRGLPHCHLLLWLKETSRIARNEDIDRYISAELPNPVTDPEGHRVISEFMLHGPCGEANKSAPCMKNRDECKKNFPKPYCSETFVDKKGFVHYRRRDTRITATKQNLQLDNTYVIPYNRSLCMRFYAHINVEYCEWTMLIKYLFKYISKGTDRIIAHVTRTIGDGPSSSSRPTTQVDEIKNFQDARYIGPHEACWRILGFDIHSRQPAVQILAVHLENMQRVTFRAGQRLQAIVDDERNKRTTLTEWLRYNRESADGHHLTYSNFPKEFVWYSTDRTWKRRQHKNTSSIGRLTYIHPSAGDLFYLRMLLCHQKGRKSFKHIRTVNGEVYPTNRAACEAMGLLGNDQEWTIALHEASLSATAAQMRALFVKYSSSAT